MSIIAILVPIAMAGAGIYLTAIYALPILAGLAAYALLQQIHASAPTVVLVSIAAGLAAFAGARAGACARNVAIRLVTLVLIAAPAGYGGYTVTRQLARVFGVAEEWWTTLSFIAALTITVIAIDMVGLPARAIVPRFDRGPALPRPKARAPQEREVGDQLAAWTQSGRSSAS